MFTHIIVSGFVQGVGYRQFVKKVAQKDSLKGWVKNISGGRVEIGLIGPKEKIEKALSLFKKGPFLSEIKDMKVEWEDKEPDFKGFEIIV
jgi:acylphosphatase